jgi:hypothetical protein
MNKLDPNSPASQILALKLAREDFSCAALHLSPFLNSKDEVIGKTADLVAESYNNLRGNCELTELKVTELLNEMSTGQTIALGNVASRLAEIVQFNEGFWNDFYRAVYLSTVALRKFDKGEPTGRFRITKAQRKALMRDLENQFGASVRNRTKARQNILLAAAAELYGVLGDRKWRSADDP